MPDYPAILQGGLLVIIFYFLVLNSLHSCTRLEIAGLGFQNLGFLAIFILYFWPRQNQRMARARRRRADFRKFP
jgi:hypothetical protein